MSRPNDLSGQRFGRLTVLDRAVNAYGGTCRAWRWLCRCDCGSEHVALSSKLRSGSILSCGCYRRELLLAGNRKHGAAPQGNPTPEYRSWASAKSRCHNPNNQNYRDYGGRGIVMASPWREDFTLFLDYMGPRPASTYTLERIDNDGPYAPGNCRWATRYEQAQNRRPRGHMVAAMLLAFLAAIMTACSGTNISELVTALGKDPATSCTKMTLSTPWGTQTTTFARSNLVAGKVSCPGEGGLAVEAVR